MFLPNAKIISSELSFHSNLLSLCFSSLFHGIGQPSDGPMGISVALTPSTHTVTVSKSMITNASFRTKKLPGICTLSITNFCYINYRFHYSSTLLSINTPKKGIKIFVIFDVDFTNIKFICSLNEFEHRNKAQLLPTSVTKIHDDHDHPPFQN